MKQHLHPESSHMAAAFVPLETHVLEGNKEQEGKRTEGTWGKWRGGERSTNQALDTAKPRMY